MRSSLVYSALSQAIETRKPDSQTIFHSDRGSQYSSASYRALMENHSIRQSMSARANPYDNTWTESFIGTLKRELIKDGEFESLEDARTEIFEYIDGYYNTRRRHSSIGYLNPDQFEQYSLTKN